MIPPPLWTPEELERDRLASTELFRQQRIQEPLEQYLEAFDSYRATLEDLLTRTSALTRLDDSALDILTDQGLQDAFRYLSGPIISADDLKILAGAVLSPARLRRDPAMVESILEVVQQSLDRRRFAWIAEGREPTPIEREAAIVASAALMANSRAGTQRRASGKSNQERAVEEELLASGLRKVETRPVHVLSREAPAEGEFCRESNLGGRKADLVVTLWDGRVMPIECKVSNSAVNSVKRLNNDAAAKAEVWRDAFGKSQVVPAAVLSGVYKLQNLINAQARGLTLFWAHSLGLLSGWIESTRSAR